MKTGVGRQLDPNQRSKAVEDFENDLKRKAVGQPIAVSAAVDIFQMFTAGLNPPSRPVGNLLFLGPTGTGKTKVVEVIAEALFGDEKALIKVDCAEFQHSHEISKLVGCFAPDAKVQMADGGTKKIQEVLQGDWVFNGQPHQVLQTYQYPYTGKLLKIHVANSSTPIVCTPSHEIFTIKWPWQNRPTSRKTRDLRKVFYAPDKLQLSPADRLRAGDCLVTPRYKSQKIDKTIDLVEYISLAHSRFYRFDDHCVWNTWMGGTQPNPLPRFIPVNEAFMRLAGFYVSEGGGRKSSGKNINFTMGNHGQDSPCLYEIERLLHEVFGETLHVHWEKRKSSTRIRVCSKIIHALMVTLFGDHTLRKKLPAWFFDLPDVLFYAFLDTAFLGDGGKTVQRRLDYSTSSETLAYQLRFALNNLGYTVQFQKHSKLKDKRGYKISPRYRLYVAGDQIVTLASYLPATGKSINLLNSGNGGIQRLTHVDDDYIYRRIKRIEEIEYDGFVYDLSIDGGDPSYIVESKVHNSPPGYLGHRETHPVFTQEAINERHTDKLPLTLILFDEIEKASDALWQLLLGVLDKGTLTLGDNRRVDMSCCIIIMTSNIGASQMRNQMGFSVPIEFGYVDPEFDRLIESTAMEAARKKFSPEFMNRIDKSIVFKTLNQEHLEQILELELEAVQQRILQAPEAPQFVFGCTDEVKAHLLHEGTDLKYGARYLKRTLERNIVFPLSNLVATNQIKIGDFIRIAFDQNKKFTFTVESDNSLVPALLAKFKSLKPAKELSETSSTMKLARKKLKELREARERLAEAKAMRQELEEEEDREDQENEKEEE